MTAIAITLFCGALFVVLVAAILLRQPRKLPERRWAKPAKKCGPCGGRGTLAVSRMWSAPESVVCFECEGTGLHRAVEPTRTCWLCDEPGSNADPLVDRGFAPPHHARCKYNPTTLGLRMAERSERT